MTDKVSELFKLMDRWRHLPGYRLEPQVAPYFAMYLPEILKDKFGKINETVIPEFPLRLGTLCDESTLCKSKNRKKTKSCRCSKAEVCSGRPNMSKKVDFVAFGEKATYLVELKTDMKSIKPNQIEYLATAEKVGFPKLAKAVKKMKCASSGQKPKYSCLIKMLESVEFEEALETKVVFLLPNKESCPESLREFGWDDNIITFEEVANKVKESGNLGKILACHLLKWKKSPID